MNSNIKSDALAILERTNPAVIQHPNFHQYLHDLETYMAMPNHETKVGLWPCLDDKTAVTHFEQYYFYQDTWAAKKVFEIEPDCLVDVGSTALLVGILSQRYLTISVDIRPLPVTLPNLECKKGTILDLPFLDNSVELLTSLCVIEHIGLGRYGDPLDTEGSKKAFREISRVVRPGGHVLISLPLSHTSFLLYNAHRVFERSDVLCSISDFKLVEELYLYPRPGSAMDIHKLVDFQYCVWCAHFMKY